MLNPAQKICDLLSHHYIFLSEKQMIGCLLASAQQNNAVQVLTLDVQGGPLLPPTRFPRCIIVTVSPCLKGLRQPFVIRTDWRFFAVLRAFFAI